MAQKLPQSLIDRGNKLRVEGLSTKVIAARLGISEGHARRTFTLKQARPAPRPQSA